MPVVRGSDFKKRFGPSTWLSHDIEYVKRDRLRNRKAGRRPQADDGLEEIIGSMPPEEADLWAETYKNAFGGKVVGAAEKSGLGHVPAVLEASVAKAPDGLRGPAATSQPITVKKPKIRPMLSGTPVLHEAGGEPPSTCLPTSAEKVDIVATAPTSLQIVDSPSSYSDSQQAPVLHMTDGGPLMKSTPMSSPQQSSNQPLASLNMPVESIVVSVEMSKTQPSRAPSPPPANEAVTQQYTRHERHWRVEDEIVVIQCGQTVFDIRQSQLVESPLLAKLLSPATSTTSYEGRRLVDVTAHCEDVEGVALVLDVLKCSISPFDYKACRRPALLCLIGASHALEFEGIFKASIRTLDKIYPADAREVARSTRMPLDEAIGAVGLALRCNSHLLGSIFRRAMYDILTASTANLQVYRPKLAEVLMGAIFEQREAGLISLRDHCTTRWAEFRVAPPQEYSSLCNHVPAASPATDAQRIDKCYRWFHAVREIDLDFEEEEKDWSNDVLRALHLVRQSKQARPYGWKECPGDQCKATIKEAWDRRIRREGEGFQKLLRKYFPFPFVAEERMDVDA